MNLIKIEVVTPTGLAFAETVIAVTVTGSKGSFQVLYNHAPILSNIEVGKIKITDKENQEKYYATGGGTIEVLNNNVLILVESFESSEQIDKKRAEESMERAKKRLQKSEKEIDYTRAENSLKRAINRIKISTNYYK